MPISILHVGLPLDHPSIPLEDRPKLTKRLTALRETMRSAGYDYEIVCASPEIGLDDFKHRLSRHPCDGVLIGGGVASNPDLTFFMEQIVDATHQTAPKARIMFHSHSCDVLTTINRWFNEPSIPKHGHGSVPAV